MKRMLTCCLLAIAWSATGTMSYALEAYDEPDRQRPTSQPAPALRPLPRIFSIFDANRDGILSKDEMDNAGNALAKFDTDGDGQVTPRELFRSLMVQRGGEPPFRDGQPERAARGPRSDRMQNIKRRPDVEPNRRSRSGEVDRGGANRDRKRVDDDRRPHGRDRDRGRMQESRRPPMPDRQRERWEQTRRMPRPDRDRGRMQESRRPPMPDRGRMQETQRRSRMGETPPRRDIRRQPPGTPPGRGSGGAPTAPGRPPEPPEAGAPPAELENRSDVAPSFDPQRRVQRLLQLDGDGDGALSAEELPDWMKPMFERLDGDGNGKLDADELHTLAERLGGRSGRNRPRGDASRSPGAQQRLRPEQ